MKLTKDQYDMLNMSLVFLGEKDCAMDGFGLSVRTRNILEQAGVSTVGDLLRCCPLKSEACARKRRSGEPCSRRHILDIRNFGKRTLLEVYAALAAHGFKLKHSRSKQKVKR